MRKSDNYRYCDNWDSDHYKKGKKGKNPQGGENWKMKNWIFAARKLTPNKHYLHSSHQIAKKERSKEILPKIKQGRLRAITLR